MIRFSCPQCGTSLKFPDDKAGTKTTCPRCSERLEVPSPDAGDEPVRETPRARGQQAALKKSVVGKAMPPAKTGTGKRKGAPQNKKIPVGVYIGGGAGVLVVGAIVAFSLSGGKKEGGPPAAGSAMPTANLPVITPARASGAGSPPAAKAAPAPTEVAKKPPENIPAVPMTKFPATWPGSSPTLRIEEVYQRTLKGVVWIVIVNSSETGGIMGSGFLVDKQNRLVITNRHVTKEFGQGTPFIVFPDYERGELVTERSHYMQKIQRRDGIPCSVAIEDPERDLAVVRLADLPPDVEPLRLAKNSARAGENVYSVGNPGNSNALFVLSSGVVRGQPHHIHFAVEEQMRDVDVIEAQAPVFHGDSGGPMVDGRAEVVAVTSFGSTAVNLMNTFIDVKEVRRVLKEYYRKNGLAEPTQVDDEKRHAADVTRLMAGLDAADARQRTQAAEGLGQIGAGARSAAPNLVKALGDKNASVRKAAVQALEQIGSSTPGDIPALVEMMKDRDPEVRLPALKAIMEMGPDAESAVPSIAALLRDPEWTVRQQAARALGELGSAARAGVSELARALKEEKRSEVRADVALALGKIGSDALPALPAMKEALNDKNEDVRINILVGLEKLGPDAKETIPLLIKALKERNPTVRDRAILALGAMGEAAKDAVKPLVELLDDQNSRKSATKALVKVGKPAVPALSQILQRPGGKKQQVLLEAVQALGQIGEDARSALGTLRYFGKNHTSDPKLNEAVADAVKKISGEGK